MCIRDSSSTRRGTERPLATSSTAPGMAPKDKTVESYKIKEKKRQDFNISTPTGTPRTPRRTAGPAISAANAPAPAASVAAQRPAGQPAQISAGQPAQSSAGQPALALEMPVECRECWGKLRTSNRMKINPAYHPQIDDGSDRYMSAQCDLVDTAVHYDQDAHARQTVRNFLRKRPALTHDSAKEYFIGIFEAEGTRKPTFSHDQQRQISEWLTTALRHKAFHKRLSF
eukprot:1444545-Pyramimonas_sp.AAC.1